jgi:hypothetical protein
LGPVFLEEGVKAERYLQLFNGAWEPHVDEMPLVVRRSDFVQDGAPPHTAGELRKLLEKFFPGEGLCTGDRPNDHQIRRTSRPNIFFFGVICRHLCTRPVHAPLTQLKKTSSLLLQTSHLRLNVCDAACSIVFTCSSNRKHINLNICVASVTPYETGLTGHAVYVICGNVRPLSFRRFWVGFSVEFPALLPCFQRTRGTGRVHDLLKGDRCESM